MRPHPPNSPEDDTETDEASAGGVIAASSAPPDAVDAAASIAGEGRLDPVTAGTILAPAVLLVVLAVVSRPHEFWLDEGYSLAAAARPWTSVTGEHGTMSAFYLLFAGWTRISTSPWWIRALPMATMAGAVATFTGLTIRQYGRGIGARAGVLAATAYIVVDLGNELRSYALVGLIIVTSWTALDHGIDHPRQRRWWVLHTGCCVLLPFAHGLAVMQLGAQALALLVARPDRGTIQRAVVGYGASGVTVLVLVANGLGNEGPSNWNPPPTWADLPDLLGQFSSPIPVLGLLMAATMALGVVLQTRATLHASTPLERFRSVQPVAWGVLSLSMLLAFSLIHNHLIPRYTTASAFGLVLLLAVGAARLDRAVRPAPMATIALVAASLIGVLALADSEPRAWTNAIDFLEQEARPGDAIIFPTDDVRIPFEANWNRDDRVVEPELLGTGQSLGSLRRYAPARTVDDLVAATVGADRIWVVNQPYQHVADHTPAFLAAMAGDFEVVDDYFFGHAVSLHLLERRAG